jgi:hypothetical protein
MEMGRGEERRGGVRSEEGMGRVEKMEREREREIDP